MIAIISDIHGNYPALQAVLREIDAKGCDNILSLGDIAGYYCMVNECIDELRKRKIVNLMGNHDSYLLGMGKCPRSTTVNNCIEYQKKVISKENLEYLKESPLTYEDDLISARHGGWNDPIDEYIGEFDFCAVDSMTQRIFCSGHTHVQKIRAFEDKVYFNPGSVGQPRDGDSKACYAIIDKGAVYLYRTQYDIDAIAMQMSMKGFEKRIYECLFYGTKVKTFGT